jgi:NAD(P)-dependent dehydrogenase (short-subunit alcohol dehydrogenase family)
MTQKYPLKGKTILITGATDGIGKETARQLAAMGARILLHGRNAEKAARVREGLVLSSGNEAIEILIADLQSLAQVRRLAEDVSAQKDRLDVLINNAGVYMEQYRKTPDGYEMTFAVNHLAPFLLTNLLLDMLKKSAPSRIITVSSSAHGSARVALDNLNAEKTFDPWGAYSLSKLGNLLFTFELARRLEGTGVTANALHPGTINTNMLAQIGFKGKPVSQGAETPVYLAASPEVAGVSGEYFSRKRIAKPSDAARDKALQEKFWELSAEMTGLEE